MHDVRKYVTEHTKMHTDEHASCDRRHVIMVHAIIRIMQSSDLFNLNSNHEYLNPNKFYNV